MAWRRVLAALLLLAGTLTPLLASAAPALASGTPGTRALWWAERYAAGCWYSWGGTGPCSRGYDCSGLAFESYGRADGIWLPRTTYGMLASPRLHRIPVNSAPPGALLFFGPGHVELATGRWHVSFGAHHSGTRVGFRTWSSYYHPTMAFVIW